MRPNFFWMFIQVHDSFANSTCLQTLITNSWVCMGMNLMAAVKAEMALLRSSGILRGAWADRVQVAADYTPTAVTWG